MTNTSNTGLTLDKFVAEMKKFGEAYGKGQNSRPAMGMRAVEAAQKLTEVNDNTAEQLYVHFQTAAAKARGLEYKTDGSHKVQVSKFRQFVKCGALPGIDAVDVFDRASDIIREMSSVEDSPLKGSAYDNLVNVARAQLKQPESALSDEELRAIFTPEQKEKDFFAKMAEVAKRLEKLHEEAPSVGAKAEIEDAILSVRQSVSEAGGDVDAVFAKDKKAKGAEARSATEKKAVSVAGNTSLATPEDYSPDDEELLRDFDADADAEDARAELEVA